jgi:DNA-binding transcriptional LysR family regulator
MRTEDIALFIDIAQLGSITQSAIKHDTTPANVSNALKRLEKKLGSQLIIRSTRNLSLTRHGKQFLPIAHEILAKLTLAYDLLGEKKQLKGNIKLSAPSDFGRHILCLWLDEFLQLHPFVNCFLQLSDNLSHLYEESIDIAIRYGIEKKPSLISYPLISKVTRILCASPDYLEQFGPIKSTDELAQHKTLSFLINNRLEKEWTLYQGAKKFRVNLTSQYTSNDAQVIRKWAIAGRGIIFKAWPDVTNDLRQGVLQRVLPNYQSASFSLSFTTLQKPTEDLVINALKSFLKKKCERLTINT